MANELPNSGIIFWPVGNGDSATLIVDKTNGVFVQVDLNHLAKSDDVNEPEHPVIDRLEEILPKRNERPYLSVLVITHPDRDHCCGVAELLERIDVGEILFTPRLFREDHTTLGEDALALRDEAQRRVKEVIRTGGNVNSGDRVRIIGHDPDINNDDLYKGFPASLRISPGKAFTMLDGVDRSSVFTAFVHAPFKEDCDGERNDTSVAMQVCLKQGDHTCTALLFGDLCRATITQIFAKTHEQKNDSFLEWDILLAPHHCSKYVMFWKDGNDVLQLDEKIMDEFENASRSGCYVVASCNPIPVSNGDGDNPPHAAAKRQYLTLVTTKSHFLVTHEHGDTDQPQPIVFALSDAGYRYVAPESSAKAMKASSSQTIITVAERVNPPAATPQTRLGYGEDA